MIPVFLSHPPETKYEVFSLAPDAENTCEII